MILGNSIHCLCKVGEFNRNCPYASEVEKVFENYEKKAILVIDDSPDIKENTLEEDY